MPQVDPELFDRGQFQAELALKSSPIAAFKKAIRQFREVLDNRFNSGRDIRRLIEDRAWCVDQILQQAWQRFDWGDDADIALVAVGGYGRGELHPYSDVDLLILLDSEDQESFREPIEGFLTLLWDIGLEVGQSVRSVQQCAEEARADLTVITTLMECRTICGPDSLRQRMLARRMIDAGASLVVGGHPHVIQDAELYRGKLIVYSLGNFVFDGFDLPEERQGWLLRLEVDRRGLKAWQTRLVQIDTAGTPVPVSGAGRLLAAVAALLGDIALIAAAATAVTLVLRRWPVSRS